VNPCLLIPIYNHPDTIRSVVASLAYLDLACLIVDDGSDSPTAEVIDRIESHYDWVEVLRLPRNCGRGAALKAGYRHAATSGHTHAIQIDADGQHAALDVPRFLEAAHRSPRALILGAPIFDESAPKIRLHGRKLSRWMVWFETFSFAVRDPLCGFRGVPLAPAIEVLDNVETGDRMDFDLEIAVRLVWGGVPIETIPTRVIYCQGGISHFAMFHDNVRLVSLHARLAVGGLLRQARLLGQLFLRGAGRAR